jgi:phosphatidylserine decarboxylase
MVRDGYYYGGSLLLVSLILWFTTHWLVIAVVPIPLAIFFLWFFRDPERVIPMEPGLVVSPGDGLVQEADWIETTGGSRLRVTIFLSVVDVHVNRTPIGGTVKLVDYRRGQFVNAMKPESAVLNEQTLITIEDGEFSISFKQIAGLLARRIICDLKEGQKVLPAEAQLYVKIGDRVKGGSSVIGRLPMSAKA